jgi:hypothetical protein
MLLKVLALWQVAGLVLSVPLCSQGRVIRLARGGQLVDRHDAHH